MEFFKTTHFRITKGLLRNNNFSAEINTGTIRINKKMSLNCNPYFNCIVIYPELEKQETFTVDEFVFNKYTNRFTLLNNRKIGEHLITADIMINSIITLYSYDNDTILIVIDDKEKQEDYDITR